MPRDPRAARRIAAVLGFTLAYCAGLFCGLRPFYYLPVTRVWTTTAVEGIRMGYFSLLVLGAGGALLAVLLTSPQAAQAALSNHFVWLQRLGVVVVVGALAAIAVFELSRA